MDRHFVPEVVLRPSSEGQTSLPLASEGILRWVWEHKYGSMLIEVIHGDVFVNGERVEPHAP